MDHSDYNWKAAWVFAVVIYLHKGVFKRPILMDGSIHTTGAIVYAPGAGPLALGPNAVRKKNNKQHDHHPPCVAMYFLF